MACQAETAHLVPAGTSFVHSAEALTLRDMLVATGTMENGGVKGVAWRASTVLQAERWLCAQCDVAFTNSVSSCPTCEVASASMQLVANNDLLARSLEAANSCAYGRQLRFLQHRQQHDGIIPSLGRFDDDDYDDLVEQSIDDLGASVRSSDRRDFLPDGVRHFHAYTQICTTAKFGFATKEQGTAFVNSGKASAVLSEFLTLIGSKTTARASDGGMLTVQRHPKGGFVRLMFANLTEHDLRIGRAILGVAPTNEVPESVLNYDGIGTLVREGRLSATSLTYKRLHALAASLFITVAQRERAEGGRLYSPGTRIPERRQFLENAVHIPRCYIAELASLLLSMNMGDRLRAIEDARIASEAKQGFVSFAPIVPQCASSD